MFPSQRPEHIRTLLEHKPKSKLHFGPPPSPSIPIGMTASQMSTVFPLEMAMTRLPDVGVNQTLSRVSAVTATAATSRMSRSRSRHGVSVAGSRSRSQSRSRPQSKLEAAQSNAFTVRFQEDSRSTVAMPDTNRELGAIDTMSLIYRSKSTAVDRDKEARMKAMPSAWSTQRTNITNQHPYSKFLEVVDKDIDDPHVYLTLQDVEKSSLLARKTNKQQEIFTRLCQNAIKNRRAAREFYSTMYQSDKSKKVADMYNFPQSKALMDDFMLKLALRRQELSKKNTRPMVVLKREVADERLTEQHLTAEEKELAAQERPVFCLRGWTTVGKPTEDMFFPNSFAELSSLRKPRDDPPGYQRFNVLVPMKEFRDDQIFMRVRGNLLTIDGVIMKVKNKARANCKLEGTRISSEFVELPPGVSAGRLRIGRSSDGILVVQEPWKY